MSRPYVGCSGFMYPQWRGTFYPGDLPERSWFGYYCGVFATVELNVTFYRILRPETFARWQRESPPGFTFCVKGNRFITHIRRLAEPEAPLERFFSGALHLGDKLAVVLWQLPPGFSRDVGRLAHFLASLDRYPARNALEFRHESWLTEEIVALCEAHRVALCMADWPPSIDTLPLTTDFVYMRRHGREGDYRSCYAPGEIAADARRIGTYLADGRDVYIYFNNDFNGHAPRNALELSGLMR